MVQGEARIKQKNGASRSADKQKHGAGACKRSMEQMRGAERSMEQNNVAESWSKRKDGASRSMEQKEECA
jgi:hypothetical protein